MKMIRNGLKHVGDITFYMYNYILKYLCLLLVIFYRNVPIISFSNFIIKFVSFPLYTLCSLTVYFLSSLHIVHPNSLFPFLSTHCAP